MAPKAMLMHAIVEWLDARIKSAATWQLWLALSMLAVFDYIAFMFDLIPLVDEVIVGGLTIKLGSELLRRRKLAAGEDPKEIKKIEEATKP